MGTYYSHVLQLLVTLYNSVEQLVSTSQCGQSLQLWAVDSPSCAAQCHRRLRVPHPELATRQALAVDVLMHNTVCIECSRDVSQRF